MQLETFWTATTVGALRVGAFLFALTLVLINTKSPTVIQFETSWTDALEASIRVLTSAWRRAEALLFKTLVNIQTAISILGVARGTHADVTPLRVHTLMLAIV